MITMLLTIGAGIHAQDFDLDSQRKESQAIPHVPGVKIDHKGMPINPVPHSMETDGTGSLDPECGFRIKDRNKAFNDETAFLPAGDIPVEIVFGEKAAARKGVKAIDGAYAMSISGKGISITGYNERGAYYGLQTLKQVLRSGRLPYMTVNDWPDLKYRGVVEGFYGTPWSYETRLSLIRFYGMFKLNTYIYGPKDDPYHSCPNWRLPYPEDEAEKISGLVRACRENRVDFVWAIHPGQDIKWNEEDYGNLLNKFNLMYGLGVRHFAIFFDDISGEGTDPVRQVELLNRLNAEFVREKGDVGNLIVCPTDYSRLWAKPGPDGSLSIYGKSLDPDIEVFWTGDFVCSDLTPETLDWINSRIRRPALYWWNFPVTDYARHIVMQGPAYGLDQTLTGENLCGLVSNPMEYGESSKIALYGVADYCWNIAGYNPMDNWERGLAEIVPGATEAYRTFAIHSCDTETGYRRDESWETTTFRIGDDFTEGQFDALYNEFTKIEKVPAEMEKGCSNKALLDELRPWLEEFGKLGSRGKRTLDLIRTYRSGNMYEFWPGYVGNMMDEEEIRSYNAHKSGTMKLHPFYENAMDDLGAAFYSTMSGEETPSVKGIGNFPNVYTILNKYMFDNDSTTFYTTGLSQSDGSWIGADLGKVTPVKEVSILQGRNSVDDVDYFDHAVLEYSEDGKSWTPLIDEIKEQYVIRWEGDPVNARYVRLRRLDSQKQNWAAIRSFDINPVRLDRLGFKITAGDTERLENAFDRNVQTTCYFNGEIILEKNDNMSSITVIADPDCAMWIEENLDDGTGIAHLDAIHADLNPETKTVSINVAGRIHEIIVR